MPRKNRDVASMTSKTVKVQFRRTGFYTHTSGGADVYPITANALGDVVASMRTSFEHYRLNRLKVSYIPACTPVSGLASGVLEPVSDLLVSIGYIALDHTKFSSPSMNSLSQFPVFAMAGGGRPVHVRVPLRELRNTTVPWLETTSTGSESEAFQEAGTIVFRQDSVTAITGGWVCYILIEGEVEFRDRIDNSVSLLARGPSVPSYPETKEDSPDTETDADAEIVSVASGPDSSRADRPVGRPRGGRSSKPSGMGSTVRTKPA